MTLFRKQLPDVDITQDAVSKKLNGGIATYINNLEAVKTQVAGLAKFVTDTVPDDQEFYTPIYFRVSERYTHEGNLEINHRFIGYCRYEIVERNRPELDS